MLSSYSDNSQHPQPCLVIRLVVLGFEFTTFPPPPPPTFNTMAYKSNEHNSEMKAENWPVTKHTTFKQHILYKSLCTQEPNVILITEQSHPNDLSQKDESWHDIWYAFLNTNVRLSCKKRCVNPRWSSKSREPDLWKTAEQSWHTEVWLSNGKRISPSLHSSHTKPLAWHRWKEERKKYKLISSNQYLFRLTWSASSAGLVGLND